MGVDSSDSAFCAFPEASLAMAEAAIISPTSEMMDAALLKAGKKVEFALMSGDDHYLSLKETRLRVLQELEKFLAANIGT